MDPKLLKFKQAAETVKHQTKQNPPLKPITKEQPDVQIPLLVKELPTDKKKTLWSKFLKFYRKIYKRLKLKHLGLIYVTLAYAFLGGWLFSWLEGENEMKIMQNKTIELKESAETLTNSILSVCKNSSITEIKKKEIVQDLIKSYQNQSGLLPSTDVKWDLWGAMFFAGTVFTTIGYGHYVPVTKGGKIAVMIYAFIGIPLVLAMLTDFGKVLTTCLNKLWSTLRNFVWKKWKSLTDKKQLVVINETNPKDTFSFPIPLALFLIIIWIFLCSAFFCIWETTWSYFDAFYFFFVSLSTIGFGDITPKHPKYMICAFPLVILGLSFVSLVINLIQNQMEKLTEKTTEFVEEQFGLNEETESEGEMELSDNPNGPNPEDVEKMNRTALGIIQTMQRASRARRRRIGVQTDESYIRDNLANIVSFLEKTKQAAVAQNDKNSIEDEFETAFFSLPEENTIDD